MALSNLSAHALVCSRACQWAHTCPCVHVQHDCVAHVCFRVHVCTRVSLAQCFCRFKCVFPNTAPLQGGMPSTCRPPHLRRGKEGQKGDRVVTLPWAAFSTHLPECPSDPSPWSAGRDQGLPVRPEVAWGGQAGFGGRALCGLVTSHPLLDPSLPCLIGIWLVETICSIPPVSMTTKWLETEVCGERSGLGDAGKNQ